MWVAIIVVFVVCVAAYWIFKPALEFSRPELSYHDGICTAHFDATNHTDRRIDAILRVVAGSSRLGDDTSPASYVEYAHKILSASFAPREKKSITCELPMPSPTLRANDTRIEVQSYSESPR